MCFCHLFLHLLFFLLAPLYIKGANLSNVPFEQNYVPLWGKENIQILNQSLEVQLMLDQHSGSGFQSVHEYGSGWFSMRIKLPQKDSTEVITTFYLISDVQPTRDEIDFEFLGGNHERPHIMHTNIYINGQGGREQQFHFWFDPTADFHDYTILWNEKHIVFFVDNIPIRVFKNTKKKGGSYPTQEKAMKIYATIWTSPWGSGGAPINWNDAPFEAHYRNFGINGCQVQSINMPPCNSYKYWWNDAKFWDLNPLQKQAYNNVRSNYLVYDYCVKQLQSLECQDLP
ncbi:putative xyloglucan endotransglucosylase/hydrolase protein [Trifolium repens]|nr:putative xyloglucan endotransglucosylase/hydrolase protein [Trifolium repens]